MKHKRNILPDSFGAAVIKNNLIIPPYGIPQIAYYGDEIPNYFARYTNPQDYHKTRNTCVMFYEYDYLFDSRDSLWIAITTKNKILLAKYKKRFENVRFITCPDYSLTGDMPLAMQIFNIYRSIVVGIWIRDNCNCLLIPNLRFNNAKSYQFCFDGIAYGSIVCLSIYGLCNKKENIINLINGLHKIKATNPGIVPNSFAEYNKIMYKDGTIRAVYKDTIDNHGHKVHRHIKYPIGEI